MFKFNLKYKMINELKFSLIKNYIYISKLKLYLICLHVFFIIVLIFF